VEHPTGTAFDEANDMMANDPELFKSKVQETLCRHTMQLNTPPKELISLIMEMLLLEASRAGATIIRK
jgi:urocanate hydratase